MEVLVVVLGVVIGSFLNVCIYRIPRKKSVSYPPSSCPKCSHRIRWYENIPIISYILILRGRCSQCKEKISVRYPLIEGLNGIMYLLVYNRFGLTLVGIGAFIIVSLLIVGVFVDIDHKYIPNRVTLGVIVIGLVISLYSGVTVEGALVGMGIYALPFILIYGYVSDLIGREAMGFGDVKLAMAFGALLGYRGLYSVHLFLTIAFVAGSLVGVTLLKLKKIDKKSGFPFGPYITLAGAYIWLLGS